MAARFPQKLAGQVPWQAVRPGVYDCRWGTDIVRVVVAGELPREPHNAPLHLFSAAPGLVDFGGRTYQRRSEQTSLLLEKVFKGLQREGLTMPYTMADFERDVMRERFAELSPEEQADVVRSLPPERQEHLMRSLPPERQEHLVRSLPPEQRLAGLSAEEIRRYLERLPAPRATSRKPRRKK